MGTDLQDLDQTDSQKNTLLYQYNQVGFLEEDAASTFNPEPMLDRALEGKK